jgi:P-type Mg2+ transporter
MLSVVLSYAGYEKPSRSGLMITKGAAEEVLERCTKIYDISSRGGVSSRNDKGHDEDEDEDRDKDRDKDKDKDTGEDKDNKPFSTPHTFSASQPLDSDLRRSLVHTAESLNAQGLRVIAVATKLYTSLPHSSGSDDDDDDGAVEGVYEEQDLAFVGFLAFLDPPKPDAADAIERLKKLGVKVRALLLLARERLLRTTTSFRYWYSQATHPPPLPKSESTSGSSRPHPPPLPPTPTPSLCSPPASSPAPL